MRTDKAKVDWVGPVQFLSPGIEFIRNVLGHEKLLNVFNITESYD